MKPFSSIYIIQCASPAFGAVASSSALAPYSNRPMTPTCSNMLLQQSSQEISDDDDLNIDGGLLNGTSEAGGSELRLSKEEQEKQRFGSTFYTGNFLPEFNVKILGRRKNTNAVSSCTCSSPNALPIISMPNSRQTWRGAS